MTLPEYPEWRLDSSLSVHQRWSTVLFGRWYRLVLEHAEPGWRIEVRQLGNGDPVIFDLAGDDERDGLMRDYVMDNLESLLMEHRL